MRSASFEGATRSFTTYFFANSFTGGPLGTDAGCGAGATAGAAGTLPGFTAAARGASRRLHESGARQASAQAITTIRCEPDRECERAGDMPSIPECVA